MENDRSVQLIHLRMEVPEDDPHVARVLINQVRLERARQFGNCWLGLELWKRLGLDDFFEEVLDQEPAEVPWSRLAAAELWTKNIFNSPKRKPPFGPTTEAREIRLRRITNPSAEQQNLLAGLNLTLPERIGLPPECSADSVVA